jgi:hypothetical protein
LSLDSLGEEGFVLKNVKPANQNGRAWIVAAGATPRGTKAALAALMKAVQIDGKHLWIASTLNVQSKPAFAKRGMHFNGWTFQYPYTFRSWPEKDWKQYLDILSYQGVNLFYLWPFIEIMPVPLSAEDQAYLEECRRVIDYAQQKHGMEVWVMQCTNRVANDRCGAADPRFRPYWRPCQADLNPGKPEDFQAIMASREVMYRILNNADGVCNIDSDPGFCPGSSLDDYVKVLKGCRELLTRYNLHGKDAKLVHWMLWGWGRKGISTDGLMPHQLQTLKALKQGLADPFWVISGQFPEFMTMCREEGLISRTVTLPYGTIEFEPAYPATNVKIDDVRNTFDSQIATNMDVVGVMGNVQTPLLQFPHIFFFTSSIWDLEYRKKSEPEVLRELARHLYPEHAELIANAYLALKETDPAKIKPITDQLEKLAAENKLGQPGVFGRKLFPDAGIVAKMLLLQVKLRYAQQRLFHDIAANTPPADCERLLVEYFDAYLAYDTSHGWHELWGWEQWPLVTLSSAPEYGGFCSRLKQCLGEHPGPDASFEKIAKELCTRHDAKPVEQGCVAPLKSAVLKSKTP